MNFYKNKTVLITGHTGFKGTWLTNVLNRLGAKVVGYALKAEELSLYNLSNIDNKIISVIGDIRDFDHLQHVFNEYKPEIVFHLAAQPLVKQGYEDPLYTYDVNVMGSVNVLECIRLSDSVKSFVNITTDKVYRNSDKSHSEEDILDGYDPYSNSKSCSELVTGTYIRSFLKDKVAISTMRSGNVLGGGDFGKYRIIPDCVKAYLNNEKLILRSPTSIRPYQHVLDVINLYLLVGEKQFEDYKYAGCYNVGPDKNDCINNEQLVNLFNKTLIEYNQKPIEYIVEDNPNLVESDILLLDNSKIKKVFDYQSRFNIEDAIKEVVDFMIHYQQNDSIEEYLNKIIDDYLNL